MTTPAGDDAQRDKTFHTYSTHHIPWYVRGLWVGFWVLTIWYIVRYAIPSAKNYF